MRDRQRQRYRRRPAVLAISLISLVTVGAVVAVVLALGGPAQLTPGGPVQLTLRMRPAAPLTTAGCSGQLTSYGFSPRAAVQLCSFGKDRSWYHAVLTNHGGGAYPLCRAKALDSSGKIVFSGPLFFNFGGGIAGLYASGHRSVAFSWYLPDVFRPIARYVTTCAVNSNPPI